MSPLDRRGSLTGARLLPASQTRHLRQSMFLRFVLVFDQMGLRDIADGQSAEDETVAILQHHHVLQVLPVEMAVAKVAIARSIPHLSTRCASSRAVETGIFTTPRFLRHHHKRKSLPHAGSSAHCQVEAGGIEPPSETRLEKASTSVSPTTFLASDPRR